ncbi:MAG: TetR/AcrR family transcriptional regulator [Burkholderiales bacterium]|nr:TetR/AcrR family transcriptional regulator [Burkholderiales bacterium]
MRTTYDDTRRHILESGQRLIGMRGFVGVGLSEILAEAAIPKGSFYHYFGSKEQYGKALLEQYLDDYVQAIERMFAPDGTPARARLMRYWQHWLTSTVDTCEGAARCLIIKLSAEVADLSEDMRLTLRNGTDQLIARIAGCIAEGQADGSLPADLNAAETAQTLYQMWLGAGLLTKLRLDPSALQNAMAATQQLLR